MDEDDGRSLAGLDEADRAAVVRLQHPHGQSRRHLQIRPHRLGEPPQAAVPEHPAGCVAAHPGQTRRSRAPGEAPEGASRRRAAVAGSHRCSLGTRGPMRVTTS